MSSESTPRKKRGLALGLAALLFATGVVAGVAVDRLVERDHRGRGHEARHKGPRRPEAMARQYREELGLDEAQARAVEETLRRTWTATRKLIAPIDPQLDVIRKRGDDEIRALLRPEQRGRFEEMVVEHERRRAAFRKGFELPRRDGRDP